MSASVFNIPLGSDSGVIQHDTVGNVSISNYDLQIENTIIVALNGNDATGQRGNWNKPFRTLQAAINAAQDGDTIIVFPLAQNGASINGKSNIRIISFNPRQGYLTLNQARNIYVEGLFRLEAYNGSSVYVNDFISMGNSVLPTYNLYAETNSIMYVNFVCFMGYGFDYHARILGTQNIIPWGSGRTEVFVNEIILMHNPRRSPLNYGTAIEAFVKNDSSVSLVVNKLTHIVSPLQREMKAHIYVTIQPLYVSQYYTNNANLNVSINDMCIISGSASGAQTGVGFKSVFYAFSPRNRMKVHINNLYAIGSNHLAWLFLNRAYSTGAEMDFYVNNMIATVRKEGAWTLSFLINPEKQKFRVNNMIFYRTADVFNFFFPAIGGAIGINLLYDTIRLHNTTYVDYTTNGDDGDAEAWYSYRMLNSRFDMSAFMFPNLTSANSLLFFWFTNEYIQNQLFVDRDVNDSTTTYQIRTVRLVKDKIIV